ncbi:MAG: hypothetical protein H0T46_12235 [Deltaproteobacteria bacterium]|nr:hypothetical protein [Deltaproteobacteria bacterium]
MSAAVRAIVLALVCTLGCKNGGGGSGDHEARVVTTWLEKHAEAVSARLRVLATIRDKARSVPSPVTRMPLAVRDLRWYSPTQPHNVAVFRIEDLEDPLQPPRADVVIRPYDGRPFLRDLAVLIATRKLPPGKQVADEYNKEMLEKQPLLDLDVDAERLRGLTYVVVLRETKYVPPKLLATGQFEPGLFFADAMVFRVADQTLVGALTIGVKNNANVAFKQSTTRTGPGDVYHLEDDLRGGVMPVLMSEIGKVSSQ